MSYIQLIKSKILFNWTVTRAIYLALGLMVILISLNSHEWWVSLIGIYYSAMGLFGFGCAGGTCNRG